MQGQVTGFHFLITFLKLFREINSLISVGISSQILCPKNETVSVPLWTEFTIGRLNVFWCLTLSSWILKIPFIISGEPPFTTFYISMARVCRFLICIEIESSFSRSSSKVNCLSLYINLRQSSCSLFILLFNARLWHIYIRGQ